MSGIYNFCAGPAMLPVDVMTKAQQEFINWNDMGSSVMELSHRSPEYIAVAEKAESLLRNLMNIPPNYRVLFCHGGGRGQFSAIPLNLLPKGKKADYIISGSWSKSAAAEAQNFGEVNVIDVTVENETTKTIMPLNEWPLSPDAAYVHYCPNETVDGVEIFEVPETHGIPLIADVSSTILSRHFDVSKFGLLYAGAQKNIGPSGLAIVIVREDLIGKCPKSTPCIMDYKSLADNDSMFNTPPTYAWYLAGLVFDWLTDLGGVDVIANINSKKSALLYRYIDSTDFYRNKIPNKYRSKMNIPFYLANEELNTLFLSEASASGLKALKGHRIVGGMRASIYNAMPYEGVEALVSFMKKFEQDNR